MVINNILFCFSLVIILFSCNSEEDDILGLELIDEDEFIIEKHTYNTLFNEANSFFTVNNFREENIYSSGFLNLLGTYNDPSFGQSDASFYMQVLLPDENIVFNASDLDPNVKLELSIPYYGSYGDLTQTLNLKVYEVSESLSSLDEANKLITESFEFDNLLLETQINLGELPNDVQWGDSTVSPRLILDLSESSLGSKILNATESNLSSDENFKDYLNGLYLKVDSSNDGAVLYFDTSSQECFLRMNYTNNNNETALPVEFPIGSTHNYFMHQYEASELLNLIDGSESSSFVYLQSMGGMAAELDLSFLLNENFNDWVIGKATLNIPVYKDAQIDIFTPPTALRLNEYIDGSNIENDDLSTASYNSETEEYNFNITSYIQSILTEDQNPNLYLGINGINSERLLISNSDLGMNLEIHRIK
tara:strand:+ start:37005 stop:38267 length:1263 start_codon:yes stop_codon:yes gene_type:complete